MKVNYEEKTMERENWEDFRFDESDLIPYKTVSEYYAKYSSKIIEFNKRRPLQFYRGYPVDWMKVFTPIEMYAWTVIRSIGQIPLYPQYPVLNYRLDFGNPLYKIGLECDGRAYHDKEKDFIRDTRLWENGWRIFRITGSELYRTVELEFEDPEQQMYSSDSLADFYLTSGEGVIEAIKSKYFLKAVEYTDWRLYGLIDETLDKHRLVSFPL